MVSDTNSLYEHDNLIEEIKKHDFKFPYTLFTNQTNLHMNYHFCLWHAKDRVARRVTRSGASTLVPKDIKVDLKTQMYDYPHIMDMQRRVPCDWNRILTLCTSATASPTNASITITWYTAHQMNCVMHLILPHQVTE